MRASTYGRGTKRAVFAHSGDNFYLFTHEAGHVFSGPRTPRSGRATRRDANGHVIEVVAAFATPRKPHAVAPVARVYVAPRRMTMADMPSTPEIWADK